jgi:hypothetical protein
LSFSQVYSQQQRQRPANGTQAEIGHNDARRIIDSRSRKKITEPRQDEPVTTLASTLHIKVPDGLRRITDSYDRLTKRVRRSDYCRFCRVDSC